MNPLVRVRDLVKRYGDVTAVGGVGFDVQAGEVFGVLGPNGAGKTTVIECMLGLRRADGGVIEIDGCDPVRNPRGLKARVGAQLQSTELQEKITAREALGLFGAFYENPYRASELIGMFGLGGFADVRFERLSGGQRQRVGLALAMVNRPRVVFLDEPTAGLDAAARRELHELILRMRGEGNAIVLTTHYIEEAERLCDRVAILDGGKIAAMGTPGELRGGRETLEEAFLDFTGGRASRATPLNGGREG